jgi:phage terminase large subunit-like protein
VKDLQRTIEQLEAAARLKKYGGGIRFFTPYPKQLEFLKLGATMRERLLIAGNQVGKSHVGAYEAAIHLTGQYPPWWSGRRFDKPTRGWICGESSSTVREVAQRKLFGEPGVEDEFGAGMVPKDSIIGRTLSQGIRDYYDTVQIRHVSGGVSTVSTKSYEQERTKFQGATLDWLWFDEEPPPEIYSEGLTRTMATGGITWMTFTPLKGPTQIVTRFLNEPEPNRTFVMMSMGEAPHLPPERRAAILAGWPPHERDARERGLPMLGEGAVFQTPEEAILEDAIEDAQVPLFWHKLWGIDIGINHPFAAVLMLWDRDMDVIHVHKTIRMKDATPVLHAAAMKPIGAAVPVAWPKDAGDRDMGSGRPVKELYTQHGLRMMPTHAQWPDGSMSTMAGITEWDERERTQRFKVSRMLGNFLEERRTYHYKSGQLVKINDDLLSACRIGLMMKRFSKPVILGSKSERNDFGPRSQFARGTPNHPDGGFDLFSGR